MRSRLLYFFPNPSFITPSQSYIVTSPTEKLTWREVQMDKNLVKVIPSSDLLQNLLQVRSMGVCLHTKGRVPSSPVFSYCHIGSISTANWKLAEQIFREIYQLYDSISTIRLPKRYIYEVLDIFKLQSGPRQQLDKNDDMWENPARNPHPTDQIPSLCCHDKNSSS